MGASSSGLLDEAKISHITGLVESSLRRFGAFYRQQYAVAYLGHLQQEVEPQNKDEGLLLANRPQYAPDEVLYQSSVKFSCWDDQGKKCRERYAVLRRDYKVEIHDNMEVFSRGAAAKLVLQPAGGRVFTTEEESRAHLEKTCAGILNGVKEDSSSLMSSPDVFAVYLHLPYRGHTCFLFQLEEERDHFLSALKTCVRHSNLDSWCESSYESQAFARALRLYRQDGGRYDCWETLLGTEEQVLTSQVMEEALPWFQSQLQSRVKGKRPERIRQWVATLQASYSVVLEQLTAGLEALREEGRQTAAANQALIRSNLDQITSSHAFLEQKVRDCIGDEAERVCRESVAPHLSSILEALTEHISAGMVLMQETLQAQMASALPHTHTQGGAEEAEKAISGLSSSGLEPCYRRVERLTERLAELEERFGLSGPQRLLHATHLVMEQLLDSAVYTLHQYLQSSTRLQSSQVTVKMERAKERVLKQLDHDSRLLQLRLYEEALLEVTLPSLTRRMDSKWKTELQQFEQYIFSDYSSFILVPNIFHDVLRSVLGAGIRSAVQEAAGKKSNNLLLDDLALSQYSLLGPTPPRSAPDSPNANAPDSPNANARVNAPDSANANAQVNAPDSPNANARVNGPDSPNANARVNAPDSANANAQVNAQVNGPDSPNANAQVNAQVNGPDSPNANAQVNAQVNGPDSPNANAQVNGPDSANANAQVNAQVNGPDSANANAQVNAQVNSPDSPNANAQVNAQVNGPDSPNANAQVNAQVNGPDSPNANAQVNGPDSANANAQVNAQVNGPDSPNANAQVNGPDSANANAQVNAQVNGPDSPNANAQVNGPDSANANAQVNAQVNGPDSANANAQVNAQVNSPDSPNVNAQVNGPDSPNANAQVNGPDSANVNAPDSPNVNARVNAPDSPSAPPSEDQTASPAVEETCETAAISPPSELDRKSNQTTEESTTLPFPVIVVTQDGVESSGAQRVTERNEGVQIGADETEESPDVVTADPPLEHEAAILESADSSLLTSPESAEVGCDPSPEHSPDVPTNGEVSSIQTPSLGEDQPAKISLGSLSEAVVSSSMGISVTQTTDRAVYLSGGIRDNWEKERLKDEVIREEEGGKIENGRIEDVARTESEPLADEGYRSSGSPTESSNALTPEQTGSDERLEDGETGAEAKKEADEGEEVVQTEENAAEPPLDSVARIRELGSEVEEAETETRHTLT